MKCLICDKEFSKLSPHVRKVHKLTDQEYYLKYVLKIDQPENCELEGCNLPKKWIALWKGYTKGCCVKHSNKISRLIQVETLRNNGTASEIASKRSKIQFNKMTKTERSDFARLGYDAVVEKHGCLGKIGAKAVMEMYGSKHYSIISRLFWDNLTPDEKEIHLMKISLSGLKRESYDTGTKLFINLQGYEKRALKVLLKSYDENDIISHPKAVRGSEFYYLPDFYIKSTNTIVEVKSKYTLRLDKRIKKKEALCGDNNFLFKLMVFN